MISRGKIAFAAALFAVSLCGATVRAQAPSADRVAASDVLARMSQATATLVVADSTISETIAAPALPTTPQNLEAQIADIVKVLPAGTIWARVYLPEPPAGKKWTGDAVVAYVKAQATLFGTVGGATPAGTVEVMGQQLPEEKAQEVIAALRLKPVYVISNPRRAAAAAAAGTTGANSGAFGRNGAYGNTDQWGAMTPEQKQEYARNVASDIVNADPAVRRQLFEQQMAIVQEVMRQVPPDQRRQLFEGMTRNGGGNLQPGRPDAGNRERGTRGGGRQ